MGKGSSFEDGEHGDAKVDVVARMSRGMRAVGRIAAGKVRNRLEVSGFYRLSGYVRVSR